MMENNFMNTEKDKEILISIVEEMSKSMTGAQSTKHWADNAVWFDIAPFASKGIKPAYEEFDKAFSQLKSFKVDIMQMDTIINGDMGVVWSVQSWNLVTKDGTVKPPMLVRQTNCFEKQNGQWKVIHEHSSMPISSGWNGEIVTG
ncbi:YybH family protein [Paenibacillus sp. NPDC058177]|uniref:YybH family protein n=1 Tax=Paenibacillus sp. NPDC058177 TaxID=3346369 RepID=UPI0036DB485C